MALRKFGTEQGRPRVDDEDPQGIAKHALRAPQSDEEFPEEYLEADDDERPQPGR